MFLMSWAIFGRLCVTNFSQSCYVDESSLFYTKCIKSGSGWDESTGSVRFYLGEAGTIITSFATDATRWILELISKIVCKIITWQRSADWDHVFSVEMPEGLQNFTKKNLRYGGCARSSSDAEQASIVRLSCSC
jgi:hypothetical protein